VNQLLLLYRLHRRHYFLREIILSICSISI